MAEPAPPLDPVARVMFIMAEGDAAGLVYLCYTQGPFRDICTRRFIPRNTLAPDTAEFLPPSGATSGDGLVSPLDVAVALRDRAAAYHANVECARYARYNLVHAMGWTFAGLAPYEKFIDMDQKDDMVRTIMQHILAFRNDDHRPRLHLQASESPEDVRYRMTRISPSSAPAT
jgi:hypothetical protein